MLWYEYDAEHSTFPSVFDEGGRTYAKGIGVPVLWVIENEDDEENPPEGGRFNPTLRFAVDIAQIRRSGVSDVLDAERHQNDIVLFHRTLWSINAYQIRGRMGGHSVIIGVECERVSPDEDFIFDHIPGDLVNLLGPLVREQAVPDRRRARHRRRSGLATPSPTTPATTTSSFGPPPSRRTP